MNKDEDMSNTFVAEVGQKSAIFNNNNGEIETLDDNKNTFPDVKIDPPTEMPSVLSNEKNNKKQEGLVEEDESFLETKKKNKKNKKRNPFVTFLIMIICLALGAGGSYYYFEVFEKNIVEEETTVTKAEVEDKTENESEEIAPDSLYIKELIDNYDYSSITTAEIYSMLYAKEKTTIKELDETYLRTLAAKKANKSLGTTAYFTNEDFQNAVTMLYGSEIVLEDEAISINNGCLKIEYQNSFYHTITGDCGGASAYNLVRKIVKAVKTADTLEVNVAIAITDGNKVYKSYEEKTGASDEIVDVAYASFDIEKDYTKLNQYKYTFNYDSKNNNYYLTSIELIK